MTGSKGTHLTSETVYESSEIAGAPQGSPQQLTMLVVKPEGGPTSEHETGTEELCEIKRDCHIGSVMA